MNTPHIQILMSTYNGEKYVSEQLDSILEQEGVYTTIFIRDDGSKDSTVQIITDYIHKYPERIMLEEGKNLGYGQSFLTLFKKSDEHADYIAFSDQDDVWLPHKLQRAVEKMKETSSQMYASNLTVTDEHLKELYTLKKGDVGIPECIFKNIAAGCTQVIKKEGVFTIKNALLGIDDSKIIYHDWFVYMMAKITGLSLYFDTQSFILYRQHNTNSLGAPQNRILKLFSKYTKVGRYKDVLIEIHTHLVFIRQMPESVFAPQMASFRKMYIESLKSPYKRFLFTNTYTFHPSHIFNIVLKLFYILKII